MDEPLPWEDEGFEEWLARTKGGFVEPSHDIYPDLNKDSRGKYLSSRRDPTPEEQVIMDTFSKVWEGKRKWLEECPLEDKSSGYMDGQAVIALKGYGQTVYDYGIEPLNLAPLSEDDRAKFDKAVEEYGLTDILAPYGPPQVYLAASYG